MFVQNIIGLFTDPTHQWEKIRDHYLSGNGSPLGHILILALIPAVSGFIGTTQVGWRIGVGDPIRITGDSAISIAIIYYPLLVVGEEGELLDHFKHCGFAFAAAQPAP